MDHGPSYPLLIVICLAQFMVILDVSIVNVALPSIQDGLGFSETGLQWVVNAYTITFAGFLMLGGRASDLLGRRRVFLGGIVLFGASSIVCALAQGQGVLLGARAIQGLGAAVISPASLAIIASSFAEGRGAQPGARGLERDGRARRHLGRAARRPADRGLRAGRRSSSSTRRSRSRS